MRKLAIIAMLALAGVLALTACGKKGGDEAQQGTQVKYTRPTDPTDKTAWQNYLGQILSSGKLMDGMTSNRPYVYYVTPGDDDQAQGERGRIMDQVSGALARGVLPGTLLAFAGPSSSKTADLVVKAFGDAQKGSLDKVIVVFIGDQADEQRVADAVKPTGAIFRFAQM